MNISLPYGRTTVTFPLPDTCRVHVYAPADLPPVEAATAFRRAVHSPVGSPPLHSLVTPGQTACVVIDDLTRPAPTAEMLRVLLTELETGGVSRRDVLVLCAVGLHRPLTREELTHLAGPAACEVRLLNHDARDPDHLRYLLTTSLGTRVHLNRDFLDAEVRLLTGDVEYHQFMGYGGGAKSVFPGLADAEAIRLSHSRMELPGARAGEIDNNPVRCEVEEVGRAAGVHFILNAVLNSSQQVVGAFAGDLTAAFRAGAALVDRQFALTVPEPVDAVLVSAGGYPRDVDLYQAQKAVSAAVKITKPGGDIVLVAEAPEGAGSDLFVQWMKEAATPAEVIARLRRKFVMGGHKAYQFARALERAGIHVFSSLDPARVRALKLNPLTRPEEVETLLSKHDTVAVLPQGVLSQPRLAGGKAPEESA